MRVVCRCLAACLLVCLLSPRHLEAGGDRGLGPYDIGEKYLDKRDHRTALKYYRKAIEQNDPRAHYRMGLILEDAGKDKDALRHYRLSVDSGPPGVERSDAVRRVAAIEERLKKPKVLKKEASQPAGLLERGRILFLKRDYRESEKVLLQAASRDEKNPEIHFLLGEVYMGLEEFAKARSEYDKAKGSY